MFVCIPEVNKEVGRGSKLLKLYPSDLGPLERLHFLRLLNSHKLPKQHHQLGTKYMNLWGTFLIQITKVIPFIVLLLKIFWLAQFCL